jgi:hypothetical protein
LANRANFGKFQRWLDGQERPVPATVNDRRAFLDGRSSFLSTLEGNRVPFYPSGSNCLMAPSDASLSGKDADAFRA